ncbi:hypothetical protein POPTR_014G137550v4 [Populus trichocarpa]|uniref:Uncharacterized protein n=1 Tax=Populus trichocarpa TaxID=3694 RepID=A0ACC0S065_POPTR|nr:hypothetical protein POPTR_014G137550v4 [Populus trichocarpa]
MTQKEDSKQKGNKGTDPTVPSIFAGQTPQKHHRSNSTSTNRDPPSTTPSPSAATTDPHINGPRPAETPQTPPPLPSHRRLQAESRSPASCTIADSSGHSSQKLGKQGRKKENHS